MQNGMLYLQQTILTVCGMFEWVYIIIYIILLIALAYETLDILSFSFSGFCDKAKDNLKLVTNGVFSCVQSYILKWLGTFSLHTNPSSQTHYLTYHSNCWS
jgi:hypothetical protein